MKTPEQIDEEFECQKCHALVQLGDGLIPTKYCNLCAQELVESMSDRLQAVEKQAKEDKEYIEDLCAQLCKMEDALGFKNDCTDRDGAFVPTIGPWLERVRDLIAAKGEIGDLKDRLKALENQLAVAENLLLNAAPNPKFLTMGFQEKWSNEFGKWWAIRKADQTLQPAKEPKK